MEADLPAETEFQPAATFDGGHGEDSPWLTEGSRDLGRDVARWRRREALRGFVDFNHLFRPHISGTPGNSGEAAAIARCVLEVEEETTAEIRLAWDDRLILRVNGEDGIDLGITTPSGRGRSPSIWGRAATPSSSS